MDVAWHPGRRCRCSLGPTVREAASFCRTVQSVWQTGASCASRPGTQPFPPFCLLSSFSPSWPGLTGVLRAEVLHECGCKAGGQCAARLLPQTLGDLCSRWEGVGACHSIKQETLHNADLCAACCPLWVSCWGLERLRRRNQLTCCFKHQIQTKLHSHAKHKAAGAQATGSEPGHSGTLCLSQAHAMPDKHCPVQNYRCTRGAPALASVGSQRASHISASTASSAGTADAARGGRVCMRRRAHAGLHGQQGSPLAGTQSSAPGTTVPLRSKEQLELNGPQSRAAAPAATHTLPPNCPTLPHRCHR